jgi:hypothetical protein
MENIFGYGDYSALPNFSAIYDTYFNVSRFLYDVQSMHFLISIVPESLYDILFKAYIMYHITFMFMIHTLSIVKYSY